MELIYLSDGSQHALSQFVSFVVVIGGFLAFVVCLWALLSAGVRLGRAETRIRGLELELARLHPRASVDVDPR